MGLSGKLTHRPRRAPGLHVDGTWYEGEGVVEVGAAMIADGWAVSVVGQTLHVTRGDRSKSITFHAAIPGEAPAPRGDR